MREKNPMDVLPVFTQDLFINYERKNPMDVLPLKTSLEIVAALALMEYPDWQELK